MGAGDAPATLSELRTDFLEKAKEVTGVTAINTIVDRFLNQANHDIHLERWYWAERRETIRTFDPYSTGTVDVAITNLTTRRAVTGTSTVWNTANSFGDTPAQVGMKMTLGATGIVHLVSAVGSDTAITLDTSTPYMGDAALDDSGYTLYQDEYSLPSDFDDVCDMRIFSEARKIALIGAQDFNLRYPRNSVLGAPRVATLVELGPSASVALRRRVVFGPAPFQQDLIPYRYYTTNLAVSATGTGAANLSAATDEPIIPLRWRQGLVYKALQLWHLSRQKNAEAATFWGGEYTTLMLRARQAHGPADDRPIIRPRVAGYFEHARRPWTAPSRRLTTGTRWDQLGE